MTMILVFISYLDSLKSLTITPGLNLSKRSWDSTFSVVAHMGNSAENFRYFGNSDGF